MYFYVKSEHLMNSQAAKLALNCGESAAAVSILLQELSGLWKLSTGASKKTKVNQLLFLSPTK